MNEEQFACPKCGALVSKSDKFCRNCGASLTEIFETQALTPSTPPPAEVAPEQPYERKYSLFQRLIKVLFSPSEGMKDIALAPSYGEVFVVLTFEIILSTAVIAMVFTKIQFVGSLPSFFWNIITSAIAIGVVFAFGLFIARWLIKSLIVKAACDSESGWDFRTAASVTGYAYLADVVISLLGLVVAWFFIPSIVIDFTNLEAARQALADFQAQTSWLKFWYTLPISLLGLAWKSYLGGLGTHFGTRGKCSEKLGFVVFFCLGLIGVVISLVYPL
ncbi:MAG: zinc ribbon domain-containing protein [Candidatus Bathyarchaeales archaeon]